MHVQRAAAVAALAGQRDAVSRAAEHPDDRGVDRALPRIHHAAGEQPHVIAGGLERRESKGQLRDAEARRDALRNEMGPLRDGEHPRPGQHEAVTPERLHAEPLPPRCEPTRGGERVARPLHQPPEGHARRARRLAPAALHAGVHEADERVVGLGALPVDLAHRRDPAARRRRLLSRHPVGRAVREAEPARHAGGELVVVDAELHAESTSRPGLRRRDGSNESRMRDVRSATTGVHRARKWRLGVVDDTHAHLGDERARQCGDLGRRDRPAVRGQRGRPVHFAEPGADDLRLDVRRVTLEENPRGVAVPQRRSTAAAARRRRPRRGRSRSRTIATPAGNGRVRRITSPISPTVPSEPTSRRHRS